MAPPRAAPASGPPTSSSTGLGQIQELGAIGPTSRRGRRFGAFGDGSAICFPPTALVNERYIRIGAGTVIGPHVTLSAGMVPGQQCVTDPVVSIGDRCLIGRGSGIVGHLSIEIGDDVWTGHHVYITDQNHGYEDLTLPISVQVQPERPVRIGAGSWLGHGTRRPARRDHRPPRRGRRQQRRAGRGARQLHRRRQPGRSSGQDAVIRGRAAGRTTASRCRWRTPRASR